MKINTLKICKTLSFSIGFIIGLFLIIPLNCPLPPTYSIAETYSLMFHNPLNWVEQSLRPFCFLILCLIGSSLVILILSYIYSTLKNKHKIEWNKYPELNSIYGWLYCVSWCFLAVGGIILIFEDDVIYNGLIIDFLISVFSFWTFFSLILRKRNALFLLRSYLISVASLSSLNLINVSGRFMAQLIPSMIGIIFISSIISLCIKGFVITFRPHIVELFKDSKFSYWQILVVVLLWASIITLYNTQITVSKETHSEYPALNVSK